MQQTIRLQIPKGELPGDSSEIELPLTWVDLAPYVVGDQRVIFGSNILDWLEVKRVPKAKVMERIRAVEDVADMPQDVKLYIGKLREAVENTLAGDDYYTSLNKVGVWKD